MWPFQRKHQYQAVAGEDSERKDADDLSTNISKLSRTSTILWWRISAVLLLSIFVAAGIVTTVIQWSDSSAENIRVSSSDTQSISESAQSPKFKTRREWRTLTDIEKHEYISAVLCLLEQPSKLAPETNYSAYDDWPWIHSHLGYSTHHSATFLPWHRYFLHLYETTLRDNCGYKGGLVYWDWTLDYLSLESSPVFDPETGFGGDGEVDGEPTVSNTGRCVADGPFAGVVASFYDVKFLPHCLSRGFRDLDGKLGHIDGAGISPTDIEEVLSLTAYEDFVARMESQVHDVIPYGISGDFETFTAPYGEKSSTPLLTKLY